MPDDAPLPTSRLARLGKLASLGARSGLARLAGKSASGEFAEALTTQLSTMRGLALKVGQMASYVDGLLPDDQQAIYQEALARLRSGAATMAEAVVVGTIEKELGAPPAALFATFDPQPFASASIGQVHRATLTDGRPVAVKVQHPGIEAAVAADLSNGKLLASLLGPLGSKFGLAGQFEELRARFLEELDYRHEARAQTRFRAIFANEPKLEIPEVIVERSSRRVLTSAFAQGHSFEWATAAPLAERRAYAENLFRFVFGSMLWRGLLNADPHPGNYVMGEAGAVTVLDFGCTRQLSAERLRLVREVHWACAKGDEPKFLRAALALVDMQPESAQGRQAEAYVRDCFQPLLARGGFTFTRPFCSKLVGQLRAQAKLVAQARAQDVRPLPPELLFFNRLQVGFYSVLARLDVEVDYHALHLELLKKAEALDPEPNWELEAQPLS